MTYSINSEEMQALRKWLIEQRESRGLSMRDLAVRLDKPHSFIQKVESGDRRLDVVEYIWYCKALDCDPDTGISLIKGFFKLRDTLSDAWKK